MNEQLQNERGRRFVSYLPMDEDERVRDVRELLKDAISDDYARETAIGLYRLAGNGDCGAQLENIHGSQLLLTAIIDENPGLIPVVEADIERMIAHLELIGRSYRPLWEFMRNKPHRPDTNGRAA